MEDFGRHAQGFAKAVGPDWHDHEFLNVDIVIGMGTAVNNIKHRQGQLASVGATNILVKGQANLFSGGSGTGQGHAEQGVCAQVAFGFSAVQTEQFLVDADLVGDCPADQRFGNNLIDVGDGFFDAFAKIAGRIAVAQFQGFPFTG